LWDRKGEALSLINRFLSRFHLSTNHSQESQLGEMTGSFQDSYDIFHRELVKIETKGIFHSSKKEEEVVFVPNKISVDMVMIRLFFLLSRFWDEEEKRKNGIWVWENCREMMFILLIGSNTFKPFNKEQERKLREEEGLWELWKKKNRNKRTKSVKKPQEDPSNSSLPPPTSITKLDNENKIEEKGQMEEEKKDGSSGSSSLTMVVVDEEEEEEEEKKDHDSEDEEFFSTKSEKKRKRIEEKQRETMSNLDYIEDDYLIYGGLQRSEFGLMW